MAAILREYTKLTAKKVQANLVLQALGFADPVVNNYAATTSAMLKVLAASGVRDDFIRALASEVDVKAVLEYPGGWPSKDVANRAQGTLLGRVANLNVNATLDLDLVMQALRASIAEYPGEPQAHRDEDVGFGSMFDDSQGYLMADGSTPSTAGASAAASAAHASAAMGTFKHDPQVAVSPTKAVRTQATMATVQGDDRRLTGAKAVELDWERYAEEGDLMVDFVMNGKSMTRVIRPTAQVVPTDGGIVVGLLKKDDERSVLIPVTISKDYFLSHVRFSTTVHTFLSKRTFLSQITISTFNYRECVGTTYATGLWEGKAKGIAKIVLEAAKVSVQGIRNHRALDQPHPCELWASAPFVDNFSKWVDRISAVTGLSSKNIVLIEKIASTITSTKLRGESHRQQTIGQLEESQRTAAVKYLDARELWAVDRFGNIWGLTINERLPVNITGEQMYAFGPAVNEMLDPDVNKSGAEFEGATALSESLAKKGTKLVPKPEKRKLSDGPTTFSLGTSAKLKEMYDNERDEKKGEVGAHATFGYYNFSRMFIWGLAAVGAEKMPCIINSDGSDSGVPGYVVSLRLNRLATIANFIQGGMGILPKAVVPRIVDAICQAAVNGRMLVPRWVNDPETRLSKKPKRIVMARFTQLAHENVLGISQATTVSGRMKALISGLMTAVAKANTQAAADGEDRLPVAKMWVLDEEPETLGSKKEQQAYDAAAAEIGQIAGGAFDWQGGSGAIMLSSLAQTDFEATSALTTTAAASSLNNT